MTYIVVSETEIVKAESPEPISVLDVNDWREDCLSLPRIPIQGKHNWEVWQEVEEGKDFEFGQTPDGGRSVKSAEGIPYDYEQWFKLIAIPIEQTKSEQGGDENIINQITEIIQKECHNIVETVLKKSKKPITVQDVTNVFIFRKLAELQLRINQLEEAQHQPTHQR